MRATPNDNVRIGFYVCHCGANIAGALDVPDLVSYVAGLPGVVVARDYKYLCSDPGQELIQCDIRDHGLTRVVVAACSPLMHERTFRGAVEKAGLNPFHCHMVNIREHDAWVHSDRQEATAKAKALATAAVRRVALHRPLESKKRPIQEEVLVVGGGIAGIHAALTLANAGKRVYLVEREPTIGGHMAKFDKTFPTLDCAACILTPKMSAVGAHPNITLWTYSEVVAVEGHIGDFTVTVKRKPRYVIEEACTGCLECIEACIYQEAKFPDEFNLGLGKRKPIHLPFPQATPAVVRIDPETCIEFKTGRCKKTCVEACADRRAIDFHQREETRRIQVGTIIIATGFQTFDPRRIPYYGYGVYPAVYTALEVERLVNAAGPTSGAVRLRNGQVPRRVGIVHCVGSRDENTNRYCSRVCCLYSLKLAHLIKEHSGAEVYSFYIDLRTPGKGMEEFYNRVAEEGIHLVRGKVADVYPDPADPTDGRLILQVEDTLMGRILKVPVDMLVLAVGLEPRADAPEVRRRFNLACGAEGFFLERHPKLAPVSSYAEGIFLAGCCQGPKDIPDTVAQAGAAAAEALALIVRGYAEQEPNTAYVREEDCSGCKSCIPLCPYSAISLAPDKKKASINEALCKGCGVCVAGCPSGSIGQHLFEDDQLLSEVEGVLSYA